MGRWGDIAGETHEQPIVVVPFGVTVACGQGL
jgi:hypothetical protein